MLRTARYRNSRYWALYEGETLVAVVLYKKGAEEIRRRLHAASTPAAPRPPCPAPATKRP